jgi:hypothetical protein
VAAVPVTDTQAVLRLLRARGAEGLTPIEALREVGTFRLGARVFDLRKAGHRIEREWVTTPGGSRVARYVLHDQPEQLRMDVA